jgi:hypothetical protein
MKRIGKSTLANMIGYEILKSNPEKRILAYWTTSDELVPTHVKAAPAEFKDKIVRVKKLNDIKNWFVVIVDEGVDIFDAKEALKIEKRKAGKALTILGHKSIIIIVCSVRGKGVFQALREDADVRIYKRMNEQQIDIEDNAFVKKNADVLLNLDKTQALISSNMLTFQKNGGLKMNLKDYCPWLLDFDEKISLNMRDEALDTEDTQEKRTIDICKEIAEMALKKYGPKRFLKPKAINLLRAWIRQYHPEYLNLEKYANWILDHLILLAEEAKGKEQEAQITEAIKIPELSAEEDNTCATFFRDYYEQNGVDKEFQDVIYQMISKALGVRETERYYNGKIKYNRIQSLITRYQSGKSLPNPNLRLSAVFEEYIAKRTGGTRGGGVGEPDIFYHDSKGNMILVGACKFYVVHTGNSQEFFQEFKGKHNGKLNAEYKYCVEHGLKTYVLFFRIVNWGNYDFCIPITTSDPNKISSCRDNLEEYTNNFMFFSPGDYFENNTIKEKGVVKS